MTTKAEVPRKSDATFLRNGLFMRSLLLVICWVQAWPTIADTILYDAQGHKTGHIDSQGRQFDAVNNYVGKIAPDGRQYDVQNRYLGRTVKDGRKFDEVNRYTGRVDSEGRQFNSVNHYEGKQVRK